MFIAEHTDMGLVTVVDTDGNQYLARKFMVKEQRNEKIEEYIIYEDEALYSFGRNKGRRLETDELLVETSKVKAGMG